MGEVEYSHKDDDYKVKIANAGEYKEPGGGIRKPTREEIDEYKIHRIVIMVIFGLVVAILLLLIIILIATTDGCEVVSEEKLPWYKSGVMYNIYPRSFKDSGKDGTGDFKGIIEKLSYLKGIGVNILYLSSVFKVDKDVDYGYSVIDFKDTNTDYGSLKDFEKLVDAAHGKGMKVIIEFVPCATSIEHQWFKSSSEGRNHTDWYVWRDNSTNITALPGSWSKDVASGKYYLHPKGYSKKASLNWDSADVKEELESVLGFWLDKKVDGFRVVSVERLFGESPTSNDLNKIHAVVQRWQNYTTKRNPNSVLIGSSDPGLSGLDIVVNVGLVHNSDAGPNANFYTAANFKEIISDYIKKLSEGNWPSWALTNWDHARVGSNVDGKLARSLQALSLTLPGTPIVFYGDEIGMQNVGNQSENSNKAPMQWDTSSQAGFTKGASTWFGLVGNSSYTNAKDDPLGIGKKFKEIAKLRKDNAVVLLGGALANFTVKDEGNVLAYTFQNKPPQFAVAMNFGSSEGEIDLSILGIKGGQLKYHTADKEPSGIKMDAVKVPAKALFLFNVTSRK